MWKMLVEIGCAAFMLVLILLLVSLVPETDAGMFLLQTVNG